MQGNYIFSLHFFSEFHWVRADQRRLPRAHGAGTELVGFRPVDHTGSHGSSCAAPYPGLSAGMNHRAGRRAAGGPERRSLLTSGVVPDHCVRVVSLSIAILRTFLTISGSMFSVMFIFFILTCFLSYFAPDAPDSQEAGELKGDDLAKALRVLDDRGVRGDK